MLKQTELEWHRYQSQLKARRDRDAEMRDVRAEGVIERIHSFQRIMKQMVTPLGDLLALTQDELLAKATALEQEIARRVNP